MSCPFCDHKSAFLISQDHTAEISKMTYECGSCRRQFVREVLPVYDIDVKEGQEITFRTGSEEGS